MSYITKSIIVYGLKINKETVYKKRQIRSCTHNVDTNAKYCPECGKPIYTTDEYELDYPDNIELHLSHDDICDDGILGFIIAETECGDTDYYKVPQLNPNKIKELKDFLSENLIKFKDEDLKSYLYTQHLY